MESGVIEPMPNNPQDESLSGRPVPPDYANPDWDATTGYDWKWYVSDEVRNFWDSFHLFQRAALAICFDEIKENDRRWDE